MPWASFVLDGRTHPFAGTRDVVVLVPSAPGVATFLNPPERSIRAQDFGAVLEISSNRSGNSRA